MLCLMGNMGRREPQSGAKAHVSISDYKRIRTRLLEEHSRLGEELEELLNTLSSPEFHTAGEAGDQTRRLYQRRDEIYASQTMIEGLLLSAETDFRARQAPRSVPVAARAEYCGFGWEDEPDAPVAVPAVPCGARTRITPNRPVPTEGPRGFDSKIDC
jgi:hypothetical protein